MGYPQGVPLGLIACEIDPARRKANSSGASRTAWTAWPSGAPGATQTSKPGWMNLACEAATGQDRAKVRAFGREDALVVERYPADPIAAGVPHKRLDAKCDPAPSRVE